MPSLVLCSRRTPFAGDDLRFICICSFLFRLLQLSLALSLLYYTTVQRNHVRQFDNLLLECEMEGDFSPLANHGVGIIYAHSCVSICLAFLGFATAIPMYLITQKGTPTDPEPRRALFPLCYFNLLVINLFRVSGFVLGVFASFILQEYCACLDGEIEIQLSNLKSACPNAGAWLGVVIALDVTNAIDAIVASAELLYFCCLCTKCPTLVPSESKWKVCFTCCIGCSSVLTCCLFGGYEALSGDFSDLALVLSDHTNNDESLDLTVSDIAMGLTMVVRVQRENLLKTRERIHDEAQHEANEETDDQEPSRPSSSSKIDINGSKEFSVQNAPRRMNSTPELQQTSQLPFTTSMAHASPREVLSAQHPREQYFMAEAARFLPMAQATYTWMMYLIENPIFGLCRLSYIMLRRCACFCPDPEEKVRGDYPWEPHFLTLLEVSGLDAEDVVSASFKQSIEAVPYMIALDHEWKSIVVAIRGTLSMESILADIALRPEELTVVGQECNFDGRGRFCHRGMLKSSRWIYADILKRGKLKEVMEGEYKTYRLRVIGHSLGAGCAAMLSVMLRPTYPNVRCLSFSVPGCVFSENLAEECEPWLTSYLLDCDIVPRLSIQSIEDLRDSVLKMICRVKIPKCQISKIAKKGTEDWKSLSKENQTILFGEDEIVDTDFKHQVDKFFEFQASLKGNNQIDSYVGLYPPGRIIQLFRTSNVQNGSFLRHWSKGSNMHKKSERTYTPRWLERSDLQQIVISSHLLSDHEPANVTANFKLVAEAGFDLRAPAYKVLEGIEEQIM